MDTKNILLSKGAWGSVLTILLGIVTAFGIIQIGPVPVEKIAAESEGISQLAVGIVEMIIGALALWGRVTAKTTLTLP